MSVCLSIVDVCVCVRVCACLCVCAREHVCVIVPSACVCMCVRACVFASASCVQRDEQQQLTVYRSVYCYSQRLASTPSAVDRVFSYRKLGICIAMTLVYMCFAYDLDNDRY